MNIEAEIRNYISSKEYNGALLVTGKWGCGKTFTLKRIRGECKKKGIAIVAMVSLFGICSTESLESEIKKSVLYAQTFNLNEKAKRSIEQLKKNIANSIIGSQEHSSETVEKSMLRLSKMIFSLNLYDWIGIENKAIDFTAELNKRKSVFKPLVLVFDDFERCGIDTKDLLGAINEYAENRGIKTIIVADEDKIGDEKYAEFKEKVICRTIKLSPDFSKIIGSIISSYEESKTGYRQFLTDSKEIIISVFKESGFQNLRTVKSMMIDFERVYKAGVESNINTKNIQSTLYQFCVVTAEYKAGNYIKSGENTYKLKASESFKANNTDIFSSSAEQAIKKKYDFGTFNEIPISISQWIVEGIWDEAFFKEEFKRLYGESEQSLDEKFLNSYFWSLDQEIIDKGFPIALERAYNGNLCCDELLSLLNREHSIKDFGGKLPCEVDYHRIEKAFDERMKKIRNGTIQEPIRRTFVHNEQINNQAISIKEKVEQLDDKEMVWNNYKNFISYLEGNNQISAHKIENTVIDVFDNNLLNLFVQRYKESENYQKRELGNVLIKVSVSNRVYSSDEDITTSLDNLNLLLNKLDVLIQNEKDQMTCIITNEFIKLLKDKVSYITTRLHSNQH